MFDKIIYIGDTDVDIKLNDSTNFHSDIMNMPIVLQDDTKSILAEIKDLHSDYVKAKMLGELVNGKFIGGILRKPSIDASIRSLTESELTYILGEEKKKGNLLLGISPFYNSKQIYVDMNELFSKHIGIIGNTGSGKSCGIARIIQNIFNNPNFIPYRSNFFIFDSSGEYYSAFF